MRYANPGSNLDASVFLDGNPAGKFLLPAVNPGFTWATAEINVHLRPGPHQVVVLPPSAPLQIDYLQPCLPINGLKGEYFGTQTLTQLAFTRTDRTIYFDWGTGSPANPTLASYFPTNHFSARWTGTVSPPFKADYTFVVIADDGVRLFVDGKPVIDEWAVPTMAPKRSTSLPIPLDPMVKSKYDITLEYFENDGLASVQLLWSATISSVLAIPEQVIAEDYLFPSPYEPDPGLGAPFRRGDVDLNGVLELTDAIVIFHFVHMGVPVPCVDACDVDDNSAVDDADGHAVLNYLFLGSGVPPVCPFPYCGRDLTPDSLTCLMSSCQ